MCVNQYLFIDLYQLGAVPSALFDEKPEKGAFLYKSSATTSTNMYCSYPYKNGLTAYKCVLQLTPRFCTVLYKAAQ